MARHIPVFLPTVVVLTCMLAGTSGVARAAVPKFVPDLYFNGFNFQLGGGSLFAGSMIGVGARIRAPWAGSKTVG